jgi:hypothetical protein
MIGIIADFFKTDENSGIRTVINYEHVEGTGGKLECILV